MAYPTTLGLRTSGELLATSRQGEVGLHGGAAGFCDESKDPCAVLAPVGGDLVLALLPRRLDLAISGTAGPILTNRKLEGGTTYDNPWSARAEARIALKDRIPIFNDGIAPKEPSKRNTWNTMVIGAGHTTQVTTWDHRYAAAPIVNPWRYWGGHVGLINGTELGGGMQVVGGATVNSVWAGSEWDAVWIAHTAGVRSTSERDLRIGVEVTGLVDLVTISTGGQVTVYVTRTWDRRSGSGL